MPDTPDWAAPRGIGFLQTYSGALVTAEGGGLQSQAVAGTASRQITVVQLNVMPYGAAGSQDVLRDWAICILVDHSNAAIIARAAVSPTAPFASLNLAAGVAALATGAALDVLGYSRNGAGSQDLWFDVTYYLA